MPTIVTTPNPTEEAKAENLLTGLFEYYCRHAESLPAEYIEFMENYESSQNQTGLMLQYMNYMGKLLKFQEKIDEYHTAVRFCTSWATRTEAVDDLINNILSL